MLFEVPFFYMKKIFESVIELLYPSACIICDAKSPNYICEKCNQRIKKIEANTFLNEEDDNNIDRSYKYLYYIFLYEKIIRKIMIDYKFFSKPYIANFFSRKISSNRYLCDIIESYDCIIPVPMSPYKEKLRGYNQTKLVTNILSRYLKIPQVKPLKRVNNSLTQSSLNKYQRKTNIEGAFYIEENQNIQGKKVILLDDIYTTGNTIEECSHLLKKAGAKEIFVIILAKDFMK